MPGAPMRRALSACLLFPSLAMVMAGCRTGAETARQALSAGGSPTPVAPANLRAAALPSPSSVVTLPRNRRLPAALALWQRTLAAARTEPAEVEAEETTYNASGQERMASRFRATESARDRSAALPARYRLEYESPERLAGIVLINDGQSVYRFDPHLHAARRGPSSDAPMPPELEEGVASIALQADGVRPDIEPQVENIAGRSAYVLALRRAGNRRMLERRWVDVETGRTLRWEQYEGRDARLVRRVELLKFSPIRTRKELADAAYRLRPDFPAGTRLLVAERWNEQADLVAHRERLPLHVRGFALRSAGGAGWNSGLHAPAASSTGETVLTRGDLESMTHLLYTNGRDAISVFVRDGMADPHEAGPISLLPGGAWHAAALDSTRSGFTQVTADGAAVAWANSQGGCCIAVARMPLANLLPVAEAFAADRDDAPMTNER